MSEASIQEQQPKGVKLYYDESNCTQEQAKQIQQCKAGMRLPRDVDKHRLESLASHAVVRGTVLQRYDMSLPPDLCKLDQPRERRFYYLNMPKLGKGSFDLDYYCKRDHGQYILREDMHNALKFKFKSILSLAIKVAADNGEGFNVVTPNAFFYDLRRDQQTEAKKLFLNAVIEVAQEIDVTLITGFKGLFLNNWLKGAATTLHGAAAVFKIPVIFMGDKDASSAQRIAQEKDFGWGVAESLMGEALGAVGNGAMGSGAKQAKEENDTRQCPDMIRVFGPGWNQSLLNKCSYQTLDLNGLGVSCGKVPGSWYDAPAKPDADAKPLGPAVRTR